MFCRPEDAEMFRSRDERVMEEPEGEGFEEAVMDSRENLHYLQTVKKPFAGADGRRLLLGASSDITDLRQLLSCEKLNSEVLSAMAANDDPDAMFENMAGILMKRMECDRIMLACCDRKGLLRLRNEWLSPGTVSIRETGLEKHYELWDRNIRAFHENRILKTSDVTQAEFCPGLNRDDKYRTISLIVVPVFVDEQLWGALFVSYRASGGSSMTSTSGSCAAAPASYRRRWLRNASGMRSGRPTMNGSWCLTIFISRSGSTTIAGS